MIYQLISNNCVASFCYQLLNLRQNNIFRFCWIDNFLELIRQYNNFDKHNFTYDFNNTYPIVNLNTICNLHFYHYKCNDEFKIKYQNLVNNYDKNIPPFFIIDNTNELYSVDQLYNILNNYNYNYILLTKNFSHTLIFKVINNVKILYVPTQLNVNDWQNEYIKYIKINVLPLIN